MIYQTFFFSSWYRKAIDDEIDGLKSQLSWELEFSPKGVRLVAACRWVFIVKYISNRSVEYYKAMSSWEPYPDNKINHYETFSSFAKLNYVIVLFSIYTNENWKML